MTAHFSLSNKIKVYEDTDTTDNPKKVIANYQIDITKDYTGYAGGDTTKVTALAAKVIDLPASPSSFLYILTDTQIAVRLNGEEDNNNLVTPSVQGTKDGIFIKRGNFTSLILNNATAFDATVSYFIGS